MLALGSGTFLLIWDRKKDSLKSSFVACKNGITAVIFSKDSKQLAAALGDDTVKIWTLDSQDKPIDLKGHERRITGIAFVNDNSVIASGSWDGKVIFWNPKSGKKLQVIAAHNSEVTSLAYCGKKNILAYSTEGAEIHLWHTKQMEKLAILKATTSVSSVDISADGSYLLTGYGRIIAPQEKNAKVSIIKIGGR